MRGASRSAPGEGPSSIRSLREEFNGKLADTSELFKGCLDDERFVRKREASELTQSLTESLQRSLQEGLSAERQVRERVLGALQRDMEALRQEFQQGLRTVATVSEDVEEFRHDLLAVTLKLASAKPQWQRDLEAVRQEVRQEVLQVQKTPAKETATEERSKLAATECHKTKVDAVEALLAQHVQMLSKMQRVQQVQQMQMQQQESPAQSPQHGNHLRAIQLTLPQQLRGPPDAADSSIGADHLGAGVSGGVQIEEERRLSSERSPQGEPSLYQTGQDASRAIRIEERVDDASLSRQRSGGATGGFWGTCVSGVPAGGARS